MALAAIQGLHEVVQDDMQAKDAQIAAPTAEILELRRSVEMLLARSSEVVQLGGQNARCRLSGLTAIADGLT